MVVFGMDIQCAQEALRGRYRIGHFGIRKSFPIGKEMRVTDGLSESLVGQS
jgi:hypothetical protein